MAASRNHYNDSQNHTHLHLARVPTPMRSAEAQELHELHSERAFIAASRRTRRSIGSRLESAMRASAIHKQRTGRYLHITREAVTGNDPYEEEGAEADERSGVDDDCGKLLRHLETCSSSAFQDCVLEILAEERAGGWRRQAVSHFFTKYREGSMLHVEGDELIEATPPDGSSHEATSYGHPPTDVPEEDDMIQDEDAEEYHDANKHDYELTSSQLGHWQSLYPDVAYSNIPPQGAMGRDYIIDNAGIVCTLNSSHAGLDQRTEADNSRLWNQQHGPDNVMYEWADLVSRSSRFGARTH